MATIRPDFCGTMIFAACHAATKFERTPTSTISQLDSGFSQNGCGFGQILGQREGVVDQDVEPALLPPNLVEQRGYLIVIA